MILHFVTLIVMDLMSRIKRKIRPWIIFVFDLPQIDACEIFQTIITKYDKSSLNAQETS